jgi:hypothetical protein
MSMSEHFTEDQKSANNAAWVDALENDRQFWFKNYQAAEVQNAALRSAFLAVQAWCDNEASKLGAVDGYDYRSGQEATYRHVAIEIGRRLAVLGDLALPPQDRP